MTNPRCVSLRCRGTSEASRSCPVTPPHFTHPTSNVSLLVRSNSCNLLSCLLTCGDQVTLELPPAGAGKQPQKAPAGASPICPAAWGTPSILKHSEGCCEWEGCGAVNRAGFKTVFHYLYRTKSLSSLWGYRCQVSHQFGLSAS